MTKAGVLRMVVHNSVTSFLSCVLTPSLGGTLPNQPQQLGQLQLSGPLSASFLPQEGILHQAS
jgi:hypothetical protein